MRARRTTAAVGGPGPAGPRPPAAPEAPGHPTVPGASPRPVVLILAPAFPPDPQSGSARPGRFAKYLPRFGYEPVVICLSLPESAPAEPGVDPESVRRVPGPAPGRMARALAGLGHLVQRCLLPYNDQLPWAGHALAEARDVLARRPVAAVLSTSPPLGAHLVGLYLRRHHGLPWVADFRDPLRGNPFRTRRWFFPYDALLERLLFRHADALIANTDTAAELWLRRHPGVADKVAVIWNGFDPEDRVEAAPPGPGPRRVLAHVGSLYGARHPGRLLDSLARLIRAGALDADRLRVRLVGPLDETCLHPHRAAVELLRGRGCLEYDGKQVPQGEARRAGARADYLLLLDLNERQLDLQVPAKLFEYVRLGRPILAYTRRGSPTDRILGGSGIPYRAVYHDSDDAEADGQVRLLFDLPPGPTRPSAWFAERFDGREQARRLAEILDAVRARARSAAASPPAAGASRC